MHKKAQPKPKHLKCPSYFLYLLRPRELVRYLSMNLNSSRRKYWGDTFLTTATEKMSKENLVWWTSFACMDNADLSHLSSAKQLR